MMSAYAASKAAVEPMCNAWRIKLAAHQVSVGMIHPTWVTTPLVTEGALHPSFVRHHARALDSRVTLRQRRRDDCRRPGSALTPRWVRPLHWLRAWLHTPLAERELLRAAPEMEAHFLQGLAAEGALAASFGPREHALALGRAEAHPEAKAPGI